MQSLNNKYVLKQELLDQLRRSEICLYWDRDVSTSTLLLQILEEAFPEGQESEDAIESGSCKFKSDGGGGWVAVKDTTLTLIHASRFRDDRIISGGQIAFSGPEFSLEKAYQDYLQRVGLFEADMPEDQKREIKRAFIAGAGQALLMVYSNYHELKPVQHLQLFDHLQHQVKKFFVAEAHKQNGTSAE